MMGLIAWIFPAVVLALLCVIAIYLREVLDELRRIREVLNDIHKATTPRP